MNQIELSHIHIFKTNINNDVEKQKISTLLNNNPLIEDWSVDCEDVDCVLRVVGSKLLVSDIIKIINQAGFFCVELEG
ncbi:MAG: hypothetical protein IT236_00625 [Bacteroidia bacterium]|nr:hypothetical protein [Bacteroidia bacterium]